MKDIAYILKLFAFTYLIKRLTAWIFWLISLIDDLLLSDLTAILNYIENVQCNSATFNGRFAKDR